MFCKADSCFRDNIEGVKHVLLINCGATIDICDFLDPPDDVRNTADPLLIVSQILNPRIIV